MSASAGGRDDDMIWLFIGCNKSVYRDSYVWIIGETVICYYLELFIFTIKIHVEKASLINIIKTGSTKSRNPVQIRHEQFH